MTTNKTKSLQHAEFVAEENDDIKPGYAYIETDNEEWRAETLNAAMQMWFAAQTQRQCELRVIKVGTVG